MIINTILLMFGTVALVMAVQHIYKNKYQSKWDLYIFILGIFAFIWCAGYAIMGMERNFSAALVFRTLGLLGVLGFLVTECALIFYISGVLVTHRKTIFLGVVLAAAADLFFFSRKSVLTFTRVGERTCYYANASFPRFFHYIYYICMLMLMFWMGYVWLKKVKLKREKQIIYYTFILNFVIVFFSIFDTLMPLLKQSSIPSSGVGAVLAYIGICYMEARYNAFQISLPTMSQYIYKYASMPMIIFSHDRSIAMINAYGKEFLGVDGKEQRYLYQIFDVSREDYREMFTEIEAKKEEQFTCRLKSRQDGRFCSLTFNCIKDSFGENYCILCFVTDLTREVEKVEELKAVKVKLEKDLKDKTDEAQWTVFQAITSMANAIDAKDEYTKGHSVRVAEYSEMLARYIGWNEDRVKNLHYIALLHDIGKIGVPDSVLNKPERLTNVEFKLIQSHTVVGGEILKDITMVEHLADGAKYHHERYDGNGYPNGLKGEEIPLEARLICIADAYDAMNTDRIYRKRLSPEIIRNQLVRGRGVQFDPELTDDFLVLLSTGKIGDYAPDMDERHDSDRTSRMLQLMLEKNLQQKKRLEEQQKQRESNQDEKDYVTGVFTRKKGEEHIRKSMAIKPGCLAVIDIDNLKRANIIYGHIAGDTALKILSHILLKYEDDAIAARYGGDEFLFYIKKTDVELVKKMINEVVYSYKCEKDKDPNLKRTSLSIGLCVTHLGDAYEQIYQKAAKVLYNVKQTGKNNFSFYKDISYNEYNSSTVDLRLLLDSLNNRKQSETSTLESKELDRISRFVKKYIADYSGTVHLAMITVQYKEGAEGFLERQEYLMNGLLVSIMDNVHDTNATIRFSNVQHLIIFKGSKENAVAVIDSIFKKFYKICNDRNVENSYDIVEYERLTEQ